MNKIKRLFLLFLMMLVFGLILIWSLNAYILQETDSRLYKNLNALPHAHTVIILGASVHSDGKLSPILQDRVDTGLKLYRSGKVKRFLLSGDNRESDYDEVSAMRNYLLNLNVPEEHIFMDPAGIDTYDSMYRSRDIFQVPSAIVVTQEFHLPRTLFIAKYLGLNYNGYPADSRYYTPEAQILRREKLANFKALYEVFSDQKPASMGKKNPITDTHQLKLSD